MKRLEWIAVLATQPPGLSGSELARRIGQPIQLTAYWSKKLGYQTIDGRLHPDPEKFSRRRKVRFEEIDWTEPNNAVIARKHGVSRQWVWMLRKQPQPSIVT